MNDSIRNFFLKYESLMTLDEKPRAILLLGSCLVYPDESELVSDDGDIFARFLPANVMSLIQPVDLGVLQAGSSML